MVSLLQASGRFVGEAVAQAVSLINPSLVVLGGTLAECQDHLLAGVRETIYRRSLPLAITLQVVNSSLGELAALYGAAYLVIDLVYAPWREPGPWPSALRSSWWQGTARGSPHDSQQAWALAGRKSRPPTCLPVCLPSMWRR